MVGFLLAHGSECSSSSPSSLSALSFFATGLPLNLNLSTLLSTSLFLMMAALHFPLTNCDEIADTCWYDTTSGSANTFFSKSKETNLLFSSLDNPFTFNKYSLNNYVSLYCICFSYFVQASNYLVFIFHCYPFVFLIYLMMLLILNIYQFNKIICEIRVCTYLHQQRKKEKCFLVMMSFGLLYFLILILNLINNIIYNVYYCD